MTTCRLILYAGKIWIYTKEEGEKTVQKRGGRYLAAAAVFFILLTGIKAWAAEYRYDDQGRLVKVIYDNGNYVEYQYDKNGNLLEVTESRAEAETTPEETGESGTGSTEETSEAETGSTEETGSSGTGGTEETSGSGTGGAEETSASETEETEETREQETTAPEETREPETTEPGETGESETSRPDDGGDGDDNDNGGTEESRPQEEGDSWRSVLTEWFNQTILRYRQLFQYFQQWLQTLTEMLKRENG